MGDAPTRPPSWPRIRSGARTRGGWRTRADHLHRHLPAHRGLEALIDHRDLPGAEPLPHLVTPDHIAELAGRPAVMASRRKPGNSTVRSGASNWKTRTGALPTPEAVLPQVAQLHPRLRRRAPAGLPRRVGSGPAARRRHEAHPGERGAEIVAAPHLHSSPASTAIRTSRSRSPSRPPGGRWDSVAASTAPTPVGKRPHPSPVCLNTRPSATSIAWERTSRRLHRAARIAATRVSHSSSGGGDVGEQEGHPPAR